MYDQTRVYDLSFVSPKKGEKSKPAIVFSINEGHLGELNKFLRSFIEGSRSGRIANYLGVEERFWFPEPDLLGEIRFGFGKCGFMRKEEHTVHLCVELDERPRLQYVTLTIQALAFALSVQLSHGEKLSNQLQQLSLDFVGCENDMHGHAIGGYVSGRVASWLLAQKAKIPEGEDYVRVPASVTKAMKDAWRAVAFKESMKYALEDIRGFVTSKGLFTLQCSGNACDVSIYPDEVFDGIQKGARFSCHNLDSADQQVTLIAGLARMCELARASEKDE